jgi:hypothetical protein
MMTLTTSPVGVGLWLNVVNLCRFYVKDANLVIIFVIFLYIYIACACVCNFHTLEQNHFCGMTLQHPTLN